MKRLLEAIARLFAKPATGPAPLPIPVTAVGSAPRFSVRFDACLPVILKHEGGYVNHPADPGGATNRGITIGTLSNWLGRPATKQEVRDLTAETAAAIYHARYWLPVRGDALGPGLDLAVFDYAVNSGPQRAVRDLQAVLGVAQDGVIGPVTLAAVSARRRQDIVVELCARRLAFLQSLKMSWPVFGKGWQRRVAAVQAEALKA